MPGVDRVLNWRTKDYEDNGLGGWRETSSLQTQIHHQLLGRRDEWAPDPDAGSDMHLVERKMDARSMRDLEGAVRAALNPFIADGSAEGLELQATSDQRNRLVLEGAITDAQHGQIDLTPLLSYGAGG